MITKLIIATSLLVFHISCSEKKNCNTEELELKSKKLKSTLDSIIMNQPTIPKDNYWYSNEVDGFSLMQKGFEHPEKFIVESLRNCPELIPYEAVLGGTMVFGKIQLLSSSWLIADFDDGHIYGKAIYKYSINNNGGIEFKVLEKINPHE